MTRVHSAIAVGALTMFAGSLSAASLNSPDRARVPVLLELFTSEGCSSCPPADRLLETLDHSQPFSNADLIVISEHVDYWNHLGWADPYSSSLFSNRQRDYATHLRSDDVYTPELVVDGKVGFVGSSRGEANEAIEQAARTSKYAVTLSATRTGNSGVVHFEAPAQDGNAKRGDLYIVLASDHARSQVSGGENSGRSLSHVAVAYSFTKVAQWDSSKPFNRDFKLALKPALQPGDTRVIAFVQDHDTARILAASQARL